MSLNNLLYLIFIAALIISVGISIIFIGYIWPRRSTPGAVPLIGIVVGIFIWAIGAIIEYTRNDLSTKLFSWNIIYVGIVSLPILLLLFAVQYCGYGSFITRRRLVLACIIPAATLLLEWTKSYHTLMYSNIQLIQDGQFFEITKNYGPWFWIYSIYGYAAILTATIILVKKLFKTPHLFDSRAMLIIGIVIVPVLANANNILHFIPVSNVDLTPAAFAVSGLAMTVALFNNQMLDIIPVPREVTVEMMNVGLIVLNKSNRIIDYNKAAMDMLYGLAKMQIGKELPEIIKIQLSNGTDTDDYQAGEIQFTSNNETLIYDVQLSALNTKGKESPGKLLTFNNITKRKKIEDVIRKMAYHDQLTSLPNRTLFYDRATMAIESALRYKRNLAVMLLDVDQFKNINDTLGHEIGDQILKEVASRLSWVTRKADTVARFGGDEFIVLLLEISEVQTILNVAGRIVKAIAEPIDVGNKKISVTASLGISVFPVDSKELNSLIKYADIAMYQAKQKGGNGFIRFIDNQQSN